MAGETAGDYVDVRAGVMFFLKSLPTEDMITGYTQSVPSVDPKTIGNALLMLRQASLLLRELEAYFTVHGLSQTRFLIMMVIDREPNRQFLAVGEITKRLDISMPIVTNTIKSLIKQGYVKSKFSSDDARVRLISLTIEGRIQLHKILPGYFRLIQEFAENKSNDT
jgi:DNA-binding MarR family transcriptional regulator